METRLIVTVLFFSLLTSTLGAAPEPRANVTPLLNSALIDMQCRAAFETGFMKAMIETFPSTSSLLSPRIEDMESDESQLSQYASQGEARNYSVYLQETFSKHLKQNADAVNASFEGLKNMTGGPSDGGGGNGTGGSQDEMKALMESLHSTYKSLRDEEASCFDTKEYALLVLGYYDTSLNLYRLRAQNLTDRGINSGNLLELVDDAQSQIVTPLKNEVESTTNSSQLRWLLNQYCLYDGCANGTNFHMAAKFEMVRLGNLLAVMAPKAAAQGNLSSNVTAAWASLGAAKAEIYSWGYTVASPDKLTAVWSDIRSAAKGSHDIFIALNSSAGAG